MRVIVISDTHRNVEALRSIIPTINSCDVLVHLGDGVADLDAFADALTVKEIVRVCGNCDFTARFPSFAVKQIGKEKCFFTHGHAQHVKDELLTLAYTAMENGCTYAFYGHTHEISTEIYCGVSMINPGSLGKPRFSAPSYCIIEEENGKIFTNIVSMG